MEGLVACAIACFAFALVAIPFAALPPAMMGLSLKIRNRTWAVPASEREQAAEVPYWKLGLTGGICGECAAVASLFFATEWSCFQGRNLCHDGNSGLALIFTVPLFSMAGSALAFLWTWVSFRIPGDRIYASTFKYAGERPTGNLLINLAIVFSMWAMGVFLAAMPFLKM